MYIYIYLSKSLNTNMEPNIWIHFVVSRCSSSSRMPLFEVPNVTFQCLKITTWSPQLKISILAVSPSRFQTPRSTWRNGLGNDTRHPNTGKACWISRMNRPLKPMTTQPRRHQGGNRIWFDHLRETLSSEGSTSMRYVASNPFEWLSSIWMRKLIQNHIET